MSAKDRDLSAFELGEKAGAADAETPNPFEAGSDRHNNFEVGRRFGATKSQFAVSHVHPTTLNQPDHDEIGFDEEG